MKHVGNDERLLIALIKVNNDPDLEPFREWLADSQREAEKDCVRGIEDVAVRRSQGAASELEKINEQIASARKTLTRVRGQ